MYIICILLFITGCSWNKKESTLDDKISAEVQFLDKKISESVAKVFDSVKGGETLEIQTEKVQKSQSSENEGGNEGSNSGESGKSSNEGSSGEESEESSNEGSSEGESGKSSNKGSKGEESEKSNKQESEKNSGEKMEKNESGEGSNEGSSNDDEIKSMSVQYSENNGDNKLDWNDIRKNAQELSNSWDVVESDLLKKQGLNQNDFEGIKKSINGIIIDSTNEQKESLIKDSAEFYNNLCSALDKINYDRNKIDFLNVKRYIYEAYYFVLIDDWNSATISLESANTAVKQISNIDSKTNIAFYNLLLSCDEKSKEIFYIRCSDVLSKIEQIEI